MGSGQTVQALVDLALLELAYDLHVLFADGVVLEVVELGGVVGEVEQVDTALVLLVELAYVLLQVEVHAEWLECYLPSRTMRSVSSFFDWLALHLFISSCFMCIAFSWILNFFSWDFTRSKNSAFFDPSSELQYRPCLRRTIHIQYY